MKEEIFEASLSPEIKSKMAEQSATVKGESKAHISFYDPLDETFEGNLTSRRAAGSVPPREQDLASVALGEALTGSPRARSGEVSSPRR